MLTNSDSDRLIASITFASLTSKLRRSELKSVSLSLDVPSRPFFRFDFDLGE